MHPSYQRLDTWVNTNSYGMEVKETSAAGNSSVEAIPCHHALLIKPGRISLLTKYAVIWINRSLKVACKEATGAGVAE
jgi:hypothetical protein